MKLMTQSLLIFSGLLLIISCAPSTDTAPPDNATLLANLIKKSNPEISGLVVTADNSDPSSPKLNITGLTNKVLGEPATETITIDQSQGITTTPASFTVTAERLISPHKVTTPLTVTFEGEAAVSYTVTTKISGAPVNDWFASDNLNNYISASFAGQGGTFVIAESTLSVTGLTNSPTGAGEITFALPTGFIADPSSITFSNPDGTDAATSSPTPSEFMITDTENIGNSMAYTIADIPLAALTRFTPGLHIKITEDSTSTDITSTLTITEKANNVIHIEGLTNKVGRNTYTLAIDEVAEFFTTPGNNPIMRMIIEPVVDISPGDGTITDGNNQGPTTISLTNNGETEAAMYALEVMFSKSAPVSDWFTVDDFRKYIIEASFAGVSTTEIRFNEMMIAVSGANDFANEPSETALFTTALPNGFELDTNALMSPAGDGFAAVTNAPIGMIAIFETGASTNRQEYPVTITLRAYISPLTGNITATYGGVPAAPSDITIETNKIVISGFTNNDTDTTESGTVMVADTVRAGYTITPTSLEIADPDGKVPINVELGTITVTNDRTRAEFSHPVTVEFASGTSVIQLRIEGTEIVNSPLENVSSGATIGITTMACKLLTAPTVTIVGVTSGKVSDTTPFPLYYDVERDMTNVVGTDTHFSVTRRLALEDVDADGNTNVLTTNFVVKLEFPACTNFAGGDGTEATPWQIDNAPRLQLVSYLVSNDNTNYGSDHYDITAANIDMGTPGLPFSEMGSRTPDEMETAGKGFVPIGTIFNAFSGTFDCLSNTISGLYINRPMGGIGLMGQISGATIKNCGLTDVKIVGNFETGGLVGGSANATISASYVTGAVTSSSNVGGLVGDLKGSEINSNSYAIVTVTGMSTDVGGLVGQMSLRSKITDSYAAGNVIGMDSNVGGLVGGMVFVPVGSFKFTSDVTNSYATGNVTGMGANVGGLVGGSENSTVSTSYATGDVTGTGSNVGGLIGWSTGSLSTIRDSYATGSVTGMNSNVGGLVGENYNGTITNAYAIGSVSGVDSNVGLFIGFNASGTPLVATGSGVTASYFSTGATLTIGGTAQADKKGVGSDTATITTVNLTVQTTAELQIGTAYSGWDASWVFASGQYPRLKAVVCANRQFVSPVPTDCMDL